MKRVPKITFLSCAFLCGILISCVDPHKRESFFYDLGEEGLIKDHQYVFYPLSEFSDSLQNSFFKIDVSVRYKSSCRLKELPLKIEYSSLEADSVYDTKIQIPLFGDDDSLKGKGNYGLYDETVTLFKSHPFEEGFFISISSTEEDTHGIISLGIVCDINN